MTNLKAFPFKIYFAFFIWLPLTTVSSLALITSPCLLVAEMISQTSKTTAGLAAAVLCLSILTLQWSHAWVHQQDDLLEQLILGPAD